MKFTAAVVLVFVLASPLSAQEAPAEAPKENRAISSLKNGAKIVLGDAKAVATAPVHWDKRDWERIGLFTAGLVALSYADQEIADAVQRNRNDTTDHFAEVVTPFGGGRGLQLTAVMALAGYGFHDDRLRDTGLDAMEASVFAAGVITPVIKRVVGRDRPIAGNGEHSFDPFSAQESFPSGHTTNAFAIASVVSAHYDGWVVPTIAWTVASGVAASRMNDDAHFLTDVIAGAAIGTSVGRFIVHRHEQWRAKGIDRMALVPYAGPDGRGVMFALSFR